MNNRNRGKRTERALAKRTGSTRVGILGKEDLSHPVWSIEVKNRQTFAGCKFIDQAERNCPEGKTALVILHIHGKRHDNDLVMMRLTDFEDWFGSVKDTHV